MHLKEPAPLKSNGLCGNEHDLQCRLTYLNRERPVAPCEVYLEKPLE